MLYRRGVGIMLTKNNELIFAGLRNDVKEMWQMPQGGMEKTEDEETAMWRELKEETGLLPENVEILKRSNQYLYYELPEELARRLWGGMYIGQQQRWFLLRLLNDDQKIILPSGRFSEFKEWGWLDKDELLTKVVYFKKSLYQQIFEEFEDFL